jgi:hypothetical protein
MVRRMRDRDAGLSLTELVIVCALLGVALAAIFAMVQVLSKSASTNTSNGTASNDLSYTLEELSKSLMDSKVLYANDQRIVVVNALGNGAYEVSSVYATGSADPSVSIGRLVWERWSSNASGTATVGSSHTIWVMSEVNANVTTSSPVALFTYYKDATDASLMSAASGDKATATDLSVAAFTGALPGGYTVAAIGRIRLHPVAEFAGGVRDDTRDVVLRLRS